MLSQEIICLYYHRVNPTNERLSVPPEVFEDQLKALSSKGYKTITVAELIGFLSGKPLPSKKLILLSFDDGFLDFYVHAFPLLQKYKMRAVVFLVTDWINPDHSAQKEVPSELKNFKADQAINMALRSDCRLFLTWGMAREMNGNGLVEFGSHGTSHRIGFWSSRLRKFILGNDAHWKYRQLYEGNIFPGLPIFQRASALTIRRFIPDKNAIDQFARHCHEHSASSKEQLTKELEAMAGKISPLGSFESEADARARIFQELKDSKAMIEKELGLECPSLCWPFGDYSRMSMELAEKAGYSVAFSTERGAIHRSDKRFALKRYRVEAIPGSRLTWELAFLKMPLVGAIISGQSRSREIVQQFEEEK